MPQAGRQMVGALGREPLRGQARRDYRAAKQQAVAGGQPVPPQSQFRPQPSITDSVRTARPIAQQPPMQPPSQQFAPLPQGQFNQQIQDYMYRYPQPGQAGAAIGAATGAAMGNVAGSRSEGMRNPFEPQNNSYWFQGKPNMPGYMGPRPQGGPSMGDVQTTGGNTGFAGGFNYDQMQQQLAQIQRFKQGSMPSMPKQGIQQQLTPEQQAFNDQQRAGNSAVRMQPNGTIAY